MAHTASDCRTIPGHAAERFTFFHAFRPISPVWRAELRDSLKDAQHTPAVPR
jgi:hypothetical protein